MVLDLTLQLNCSIKDLYKSNMDNKVPNIQSNSRKEIEAISEKIKKSKLQPSDLIVPISLGIVLILLAIFVFIPMVSSALDSQKELKEIEEKREVLANLETELNKMDEGEISDDLITAKKVIPKILKVSDFIYYVDYLAKQKGLSAKEISAGDAGTIQDTNSVSGPLEYSGSFENILSFLEDFQSASPYLISLKNVELSRSGDDNWNVSLQVSGFYISEKIGDVNLYSNFQTYKSFSKELEIFKSKAESIP